MLRLELLLSYLGFIILAAPASLAKRGNQGALELIIADGDVSLRCYSDSQLLSLSTDFNGLDAAIVVGIVVWALLPAYAGCRRRSCLHLMEWLRHYHPRR